MFFTGPKPKVTVGAEGAPKPNLDMPGINQVGTLTVVRSLSPFASALFADVEAHRSQGAGSGYRVLAVIGVGGWAQDEVEESARFQSSPQLGSRL